MANHWRLEGVNASCVSISIAARTSSSPADITEMGLLTRTSYPDTALGPPGCTFL
ncbi:hypothetical protein PISMIDRAFT_676153 [Pisolithus microcarpus 441]|uniref:Uncharacterized protein n=1 Tax=Pisolithus microcarpus 441 TaxID=765257 RepID=A0A0C9YMV4_9AGAM|nr:hypothetical protein BKA83DRAFT_676153 [Pisolithus microcarpus]KIK26335.1 hypothetical protein PISMIDRAFT_676153 [Pisolithus microcarpus 441]